MPPCPAPPPPPALAEVCPQGLTAVEEVVVACAALLYWSPTHWSVGHSFNSSPCVWLCKHYIKPMKPGGAKLKSLDIYDKCLSGQGNGKTIMKTITTTTMTMTIVNSTKTKNINFYVKKKKKGGGRWSLKYNVEIFWYSYYYPHNARG